MGDSGHDLTVEPTAGPSGLQPKRTGQPRRASSSSSDEDSSNTSSSSSPDSNKRKRRRRHQKKKGYKKHSQKNYLLQRLYEDVSDLRRQFQEGGVNSQPAVIPHDTDNGDEISLLNAEDAGSFFGDEGVEKSNDHHPQQFKFDLQVKLKEPSVPRTPESYLKALSDFQLFDKKEWCEVRYSEVQKLYNYSPGFTDLEINEEIKAFDSQRYLAYADKAYGAMTFCVLKQREALQNGMTELVSWAYDAGSVTSEQLRDKIGELFSTGEYQKVSSDMAQLICGHRAETVQMRRDGILHHVRDPLVKSQLRKIPPSNKHIFNAELLTAALEKVGVKKAFFQHQSSSQKLTSQVNKNATRFPSQGQAIHTIPSQGIQHTCCSVPYPPQPSQGLAHRGFGQNRPSQGYGYNHDVARGSNHNIRGSFRARGGNNQQRGGRQEVRVNRKRPTAHDFQAGGKRGRY